MGQTVRMFYGRRFTAAAISGPSPSSAYTVGCSQGSDGSAINRCLTFRMHRLPCSTICPFVERIEKGEIDPSFRNHPSRDPRRRTELYKIFRAKEDGCVKVVMKP